MNFDLKIEKLIQKFLSFDFYYSIQFWIAFTVVVVILRIVNRKSNLTRWFMLAASVLMILALPRFSFFDLGFLFFVSCVVFAVGKLLTSEVRVQEKKFRMLLASVTVILVVLVLAFFKYRFIQDLIIKGESVFGFKVPDFLFIIGISYTSFRMIHFTIESYKRELEYIGFVMFLNYIFFFPSFIAGPIHRYNHFCEQWQTQGRTHVATDLKQGTYRIVHGLFKKLVLSGLIYPYTLSQVIGSGQFTYLELLLGVYAYTVYFYLDFSGYSDIAIGSARIMGIELPENFNNPFFKNNIQQLWANWHISLTSWLTDYIYWPMVRRLRKKVFFQNHPVLLSNICIVVTFVVCGMWHGQTPNFILWGLYHGLGIAIMNIYRAYKRKVRSPILRRYFRSPSSRFLGVIGTFNFFAFGIILFTLNVGDLGVLRSIM